MRTGKAPMRSRNSRSTARAAARISRAAPGSSGLPARRITSASLRTSFATFSARNGSSAGSARRSGSAAMQEVGRRNAEALGLRIRSVIDDVHTLPYPDNTFDVVTLQFASRHLRIRRVAEEIRRVLRPGGRFYHSDMLRPGNPIVEKLYYSYLRFCLWFTGFLFRSGPAALNCKKYFIQALQMFYSAQELSDMLEDVGFRDVTAKTVFSGMLGFHRAVKPAA